MTSHAREISSNSGLVHCMAVLLISLKSSLLFLLPLGLRQSERDNVIALLCSKLAVPACGNNDVLLAANAVGHRCSLSSGGQLIRPQFFSRLRVERSKMAIPGSGREIQAACRHNGSSETERPARLPRDVTPQWNIPNFLPFEQIDRSQRSPRWRVTGQAARGKQRLAEHGVRRARLPRKLAGHLVDVGSVFAGIF